jgi:hypothetical protein
MSSMSSNQDNVPCRRHGGREERMTNKTILLDLMLPGMNGQEIGAER